MSDFLAPHNTPFMVALGLLALLALSQLLGLGHLLGGADHDLDMDHDADVGAGMASLLGLGRLPLVAWLSLFLAVFGLGGLTLQQAAAGLAGSPFAVLPAAGLALLGALPVTALLARPLGVLWPQDETTAVDIDSLLARRGRIVIGRSARGNPARAAVRDRHGQTHHVMVEPHVDGASFATGEEILLVRREGDLFYAVATDGPILIGDR